MKSNSRGQLSLEVAFLVGIVTILIVGMVNLGLERFSTAQDIGESGEAKMVGNFLAGSINKVYSSGEGFRIYISPEDLNFTRISETERIEGLGVDLPLEIDNQNRTIILAKNLSKTGGSTWSVRVPIVANNVIVENPGPYPEVTILNNGTNVVIYAQSAHISLVS